MSGGLAVFLVIGERKLFDRVMYLGEAGDGFIRRRSDRRHLRHAARVIEQRILAIVSRLINDGAVAGLKRLVEG